MRPRVRTAPLGGNQEKIDELEYFLDGIGRFLLGDRLEDHRGLERWVPRTRNLSALVELGKASASRDPGEDLALLYGELEGRPDGGETPARGGRADVRMFRYRWYEELVAHPERAVDRVRPTERLEVIELISRGSDGVQPLLARVNAWAWLGVVGVPDFAAEMGSDTSPSLTLVDAGPGIAEGFGLVLSASGRRIGPGVRAWLVALHETLSADYRSQVARLAARTERI